MDRELIVEALSPLFKEFEIDNKPIEIASLSLLFGDKYIFKIYATWLSEVEDPSHRLDIIINTLFKIKDSSIIYHINKVVICSSKEEVDNDIIYKFVK